MITAQLSCWLRKQPLNHLWTKHLACLKNALLTNSRDLGRRRRFPTSQRDAKEEDLPLAKELLYSCRRKELLTSKFKGHWEKEEDFIKSQRSAKASQIDAKEEDFLLAKELLYSHRRKELLTDRFKDRWDEEEDFLLDKELLYSHLCKELLTGDIIIYELGEASPQKDAQRIKCNLLSLQIQMHLL